MKWGFKLVYRGREQISWEIGEAGRPQNWATLLANYPPSPLPLIGWNHWVRLELRNSLWGPSVAGKTFAIKGLSGDSRGPIGVPSRPGAQSDRSARRRARSDVTMPDVLLGISSYLGVSSGPRLRCVV